MPSSDNRGHLVALNDAELALLWQVLQNVQIPGAVAEVYVGIKGQVRQAMAELEIKGAPGG